MSLDGDLGCKSTAVRWMSRDTERAGDASFSSRSFVYWFLPLIRLCWLFAVLLCELLIEAAVGGGVPGALAMAGGASEADGGSPSLGAADLVGAKDISSDISESDDKLAYADVHLCHNCLPSARRRSARLFRLFAASCLWRSLSSFSDFSLVDLCERLVLAPFLVLVSLSEPSRL